MKNRWFTSGGYKILVLLFLFLFITNVLVSSSYVDSNIGWQQINEDGFGNKENMGIRGMTSFKGYLCVGLTNVNFTTEKINGCEVWCYDNSTWVQSVGDHEEALIPSGFGDSNNAECSVLIEFHDKLYAGTSNIEGLQIWRTDNPVNGTWELVVGDGFGFASNKGVMSATVFNDYLYVGTGSDFKGCEIWRTDNGEDWEAVVGGNSSASNGFGEVMNFYAWSLAVYDNSLYVGTQNMIGAEVWRSSDGVNWECLVGPSGDFPRGFQIIDVNYGIRNLIEFNGELYAGVAEIPAMTVKLKVGGFIFNPRLRTIFSSPEVGFQIWRYNESKTPKWERIVGGISNKITYKNGFGNNHNVYAWVMEVFKGELYVGTLNSHRVVLNVDLRDLLKNHSTLKGFIIYLTENAFTQKSDGCEIWKTSDGAHWVQVVGNDSGGPASGFGDEYNLGTRAVTTYKINNEDTLVFGTINSNSGCQIWAYQ